jgi:hypothetical protein
MRNESKSTNTRPENAFTATFLTRSRHQPDDSQPGDLATLVVDSRSAGPWRAQEVEIAHAHWWAVVREGEAPTEEPPVATYRCRTTAGLTSAILPALAIPNHLRLGDPPKPKGVPLHDGDHFLGHLAPDGPATHPNLIHYLHAARFLATHPESLVHLLRTYDPEALAILGRALARAA